MKVSITGGSGIIGTGLVELLPENYTAIILSRESAKNHSSLRSSQVSIVQTDYTINSLKNSFDGCDAVVHLAARRLQKFNSDSSFKNVLLDYNVFKACEHVKISNIVFSSTRGIYGKNPDTPWNEQTEAAPENPYSFGKYISEKSAAYFNSKGLYIKCLRLAQVLSESARKGYMLGTFIENSLQGKPLELYAIEDQKREFIYVKDVARGILAALNKPTAQGVFNLGSGELISLPQLAKMITKTSPSNKGIVHHEPDSLLEEYSLMNSELFYSKFNFKINWTIQEALTDIFKKINSTTDDPI